MGVYEEIVAIRKRVEDLERIEQPARSGGLPVYPSLTAGSVIFAGTGGVLAQDNSNFYWDDANNRLGIGTNSPVQPLTVDGVARIRQVGSTRYRSDIFITGGVLTTNAYDDTGAAYIDSLSIVNSWTLNVGSAGTTSAIFAKSDGSVGFNQTSPSALVHAKRTDGNYHFKSESSSRVYGWGTTGTSWFLDDVTAAARRLTIESNGPLITGDMIQVTGYSAPSGGSGCEVGYSAGTAYLTGFNRTGGTYLPLVLRGSTVTLQYSGTTGLQLDGSGNVVPGAAGTQNFGTAALYWNDVSYKTITDRGCLALIDKWEMPDGRKLSNLQVLRELRAHETDKTIYGETKLDYDYVPKHSKKTAPIAEEDTELDVIGPDGKKLKFKKGEKMGSDGVEMTSMFSVMIGAIRELADQVEKLQAKQK